MTDRAKLADALDDLARNAEVYNTPTIRAASAVLRAMEWRPISEHDGSDTEVLTYRKVQSVAVFIETPRGLRWVCTDGGILLGVTHWQPLPSPPQVTHDR